MTPKTPNHVIKAKPGVEPGVTIKRSKAPREVDYSRAKLTHCPSPQFSARWQYSQEAPDERWPSFASQAIGTYEKGPT